MTLTVKGFQSHANTALDLRENFICVVGANNIGKSALIRAVRWLLYDALRGSRFIKKGQTEASVELQIGKTIVQRLKAKGVNAYVVNGKRLDAIKTGAPPEAMDALVTHPVQIDKDLVLPINVVQQKDDPFLMGETGTTRAKILNALTGHHVLDVAIRHTVVETRRLQSEQKHLGERSDQLADDAKAFKDLPKQEERVAKARKQQNRLETLVERARRGRELFESHTAAAKRRFAAETLSERQLPQVDRLWSRAEAALKRNGELQEAVERYEMAVRARRAVETRPERPLPLLEKAWERAETLKAKKMVLDQIRNYQVQAGNARQTLNLLLQQLDRGLAQLQMLKGTLCPTCGEPLSEKFLAEVA